MPIEIRSTAFCQAMKMQCPLRHRFKMRSYSSTFFLLLLWKRVDGVGGQKRRREGESAICVAAGSIAGRASLNIQERERESKVVQSLDRRPGVGEEKREIRSSKEEKGKKKCRPHRRLPSTSHRISRLLDTSGKEEEERVPVQ